MTDADYILGTHDAEIERLGLQHRVWRAAALRVWREAGIRAGQRVLDIGCGPGFAAVDLAEIVGPNGQVEGYERSKRFLDHLKMVSMVRGLAVEAIEADLDQQIFPSAMADAAWCRWVLSFVQKPAVLVSRIADGLKPGGIAIFHEYCDYRSWQLGPPSDDFACFVDAVMRSWRDAGGEPDIGLQLPTMLDACGMEIVQMRPLAEAVFPDNFIWEWPDAFARVNLDRLVALGRVTTAERNRALAALDHAAQTPGHFMVTPTVLEVIARKWA
jgi:SAM-dependent methyltransferase